MSKTIKELYDEYDKSLIQVARYIHNEEEYLRMINEYGDILYYSQEEVDKLKKALKEKFCSCGDFDYPDSLGRCYACIDIDSVFAEYGLETSQNGSGNVQFAGLPEEILKNLPRVKMEKGSIPSKPNNLKLSFKAQKELDDIQKKLDDDMEALGLPRNTIIRGYSKSDNNRNTIQDWVKAIDKIKLREDIFDDIESEIPSKPYNVAYFGVQLREIQELNKENFIKSNIELNKDIYDYDIQMEKKTTLQLLCDRDEDADTEWVRVENVINFCNKYPDLTLRYLKYLLPQSSEVLK